MLVVSKLPHSNAWTREMEMPRMSFRDWNSTLLGEGRRNVGNEARELQNQHLSQGLKNLENQLSDKQIWNIKISDPGPKKFPKMSFKNLKICSGQAEGRDKPKINIENFKINIFEPGLGNAKNELRDRPSEMSKWALEASKRIFSSHAGLGKNRKTTSRMFQDEHL